MYATGTEIVVVVVRGRSKTLSNAHYGQRWVSVQLKCVVCGSNDTAGIEREMLWALLLLRAHDVPRTAYLHNSHSWFGEWLSYIVQRCIVR